MGTETPNFDFYKPAEGEDGWADQVNDNFDVIDTELSDERIEDLVNTLLSAGASITLTYDDGTDDLTIAVDETTIDHDNLSNFVSDEHIDHSTTNVTAGTLLTGGGSIDSDITLSVDEGNISHDGIDQATVDTDDHHSRYTDEEAQDAVNALLSGGNAIILSYDDANDTLTIDVVDSNIDHDSLSGFVANEHIDHSGVTITAGTLLTGGGDITQSRTLDVDESGINHDGIDQTTVSEDDHHIRGGFSRGDVNSQTVTASRWDSLWVDTSAAGGSVTVTLPADGNSDDGDRVEVGVEDGANDTTISPNTGQSIIGAPTTLSNAGETVTLEFKKSTSTWMIR